MRASAVIVLAPILFGGWPIETAAQSVPADLPASSSSTAQTTSAWDAEHLPPGVIPQPSVDAPGLVAGLTVGELYTDNLTLAGGAKPKQSSWITQLQPFLKTAWDGPRFSGVLNYTLTGYVYPGHANRNQLVQDLDTNATFVIVPQHLFLDGGALYGREVIDNELPTGSGTFFLDNNHANVTRAVLSPYWTQELGNVGTVLLRYSYGRLLYDTKGIPAQDHDLLAGVSDITSNGWQFSLASPQYETWRWDFGYTDQRIDAGFGRSTRFARAKLGTAVQVSDGVSLLADVGQENKFLADGTVDTLGANFWDVGAEWSTSINHLKVLAGHRFYGRSYELSWTRTAALLTTAVSYVEQPTDLNQQLLTQGLGGMPSFGPGLIPSLRDHRVYLMKRVTASVAYEMPSSLLKLTLYNERRNYFLLDNHQERVANAEVTWRYNLGPFTTLTPAYGWQRYQYRDGQINYNHYAQLALVHTFDPKNFGSVRLRRDSRNVQSAIPGAHGYRANVIFVQLTHLF